MNNHEKAFILNKMTKKQRKNRMTLESSKILGGVGAILMFVGILPYINYFGVLELVGIILVLAGLYGVGSFYNESGIFNNSLYGVILGIVGVVIAAVVAVVVVLTSLTDFIYQVFPGWNGDWTSLSGLTPSVNNIDFTSIWSFLAGLLVVFVVLWIFSIIAAFFVRRGLRQASNKTNVGLFSTAGILLLVGAVLTIILIGFILMWIAALLLAIAFFTMKSVQPPMIATAPPAPTQV
jgi:uncharacterized membrane protein